MYEEEIMVANQYLLSKYWGNFFVGIYIYLRIVLKTGKRRALASWQRKGVSAQTWVWKNGARTGRKTTKGLNMSVLGRYRQD